MRADSRGHLRGVANLLRRGHTKNCVFREGEFFWPKFVVAILRGPPPLGESLEHLILRLRMVAIIRTPCASLLAVPCIRTDITYRVQVRIIRPPFSQPITTIELVGFNSIS